MNVVIMYLQYLDWAGPLMLQCDTPSLRMESHQHRYGKEVIGKKKKERKLYKCSVEHFFPLLIVHQKLADLDKKIPLRRLFFWPRKDFVYFILFFFFLRKIQMKGVNVWSNCTMWFPLSWVQVSDPYIKVPIIDLCFCFW